MIEPDGEFTDFLRVDVSGSVVVLVYSLPKAIAIIFEGCQE